MFKKLCALFLSLIAMNAAAGESRPTAKDAIALVNQANTYLVSHGRSQFLATISTPTGEFNKGNIYVFVYNMSGVMMAHPVNPKLIGVNLYDVPDTDGKYFRRDIVSLAKTHKSGWVDYRYRNPKTGKVEQKSTYILASGDLILAAGIYKSDR